VAKGDTAAIDRLEHDYLTAAAESVGYYRGMSKTLFGRDIAYVLLMHAGAFDARMLPRLLDLYRSHGFRFVTLPQAERDPFYRIDLDLSAPPGPDTLEDAMKARGLATPPRPDAAILANLDTVCR
jgi:hypothetical protein